MKSAERRKRLLRRSASANDIFTINHKYKLESFT